MGRKVKKEGSRSKTTWAKSETLCLQKNQSLKGREILELLRVCLAS
jgi:hypothetical protein